MRSSGLPTKAAERSFLRSKNADLAAKERYAPACTPPACMTAHKRRLAQLLYAFAQKLDKKREAAEKRAHRQLIKERASEQKAERKRQRSDPLYALYHDDVPVPMPPPVSAEVAAETAAKVARIKALAAARPNASPSAVLNALSYM